MKSTAHLRDWRRIHRSPVFWIGVVLCLAANTIYVMSDVLSGLHHRWPLLATLNGHRLARIVSAHCVSRPLDAILILCCSIDEIIGKPKHT
jgi:hypothetical protein